jgi:hypothetical protein
MSGRGDENTALILFALAILFAAAIAMVAADYAVEYALTWLTLKAIHTPEAECILPTDAPEPAHAADCGGADTVTLIQTVFLNEFVIQVSDRRLTRAGGSVFGAIVKSVDQVVAPESARTNLSRT